MHSIILNTPSLSIMLITFCMVLVMQTLHVLTLIFRESDRPSPLHCAYELFLIVFLFLEALVTFSMLRYTNQHALNFTLLGLPLANLLWANAAGVFLSITCMFVEKQPSLALECALLALQTPIAAINFGPLSTYGQIACAAYFIFRTACVLQQDREHQKEVFMRFSPALIANRLDEGILYFDKRGAILFMNDSARKLLSSMGLAGDLADGRRIWPSLVKNPAADDTLGNGDTTLIIDSEDGKKWRFKRDEVLLGKRPRTRIMFSDVTEELRPNEEIEQANRELEQRQTELKNSINDLQDAVKNDVSLRMKQRVHDVIGQRLSILHRYLEDGADSPESRKRLVSLITTISEDLSNSTYLTSKNTLDMIVEAFSIAGVTISVIGELPSEDKVGNVFSQIIREAATNAVIHAHALNVRATIEESENAFALEISSDGLPLQGEVVEGTGMAGMRRRAQAVNGTFCYRVGPPFTISVHVGKEGAVQ